MVIEIYERIIPVTLRRHIWKVFEVELIELGDCLDVGDEKYGRVKVNVTKLKCQHGWRYHSQIKKNIIHGKDDPKTYFLKNSGICRRIKKGNARRKLDIQA